MSDACVKVPIFSRGSHAFKANLESISCPA